MQGYQKLVGAKTAKQPYNAAKHECYVAKISISFNPVNSELDGKIKLNVRDSMTITSIFLSMLRSYKLADGKLENFSFAPLIEALNTYDARMLEKNCQKERDYVAMHAHITYISRLASQQRLNDNAVINAANADAAAAALVIAKNSASTFYDELAALKLYTARLFNDVEDVVYIEGCGKYKIGNEERKFEGEAEIVIKKREKIEIFSKNICKLKCANTSAASIEFEGHFPHLKKLNCAGCPLVRLDVTKLKALKSLNCEDCEKLEYLEASELEELHEVKVKCCAALKYLNCYGCKELSELDMTMLQNVVMNTPTQIYGYSITKYIKMSTYNARVFGRIANQLIEYVNTSNRNLYVDPEKVMDLLEPIAVSNLDPTRDSLYSILTSNPCVDPSIFTEYVNNNMVDIITDAVVSVLDYYFGYNQITPPHMNYKQVAFLKKYCEKWVKDDRNVDYDILTDTLDAWTKNAPYTALLSNIAYDKLLVLAYEVNNSLQYLNVGKTELRNLDLQNVDGLVYLNCRNMHVRKLDVGHLVNLCYLNCSKTWVSRLKVEELENLTRLICHDCKHLPNIQKALYSLARFAGDRYLDCKYQLVDVDELKLLEPPAPNRKRVPTMAPKAAPALADAPVEPPADAPVEPPADAPAEPLVDAPAEPLVDAPAEPLVDAPAEPPAFPPAMPL